MKSVPLNIFQKLMRRWDRVHPYNAAQVMQITGEPQAAQWESAWQATLASTGLGAVVLKGNRYHFNSAAALSLSVHHCENRDHGDTAVSRLENYLSTEMNRPFDDPNEPPFRPFLIRGDGHFFVGLVYQHWLADSTSIRMLMREWFVRVHDPSKAAQSPLPLASRGYWNTIGPGRRWGFTQTLVEMTRRHIRMRRVQKIDSTALSDHATRFKLIPAKSGLIDRLRIAAKNRQVKVNDIFLAALLEACAAHVPLQPRKNRRDVAVGSVVDLRPFASESLDGAFGLFLGFTNVIGQPEDIADFDRLLRCVSNQTIRQKKKGVAPASFIWMAAAVSVGSLSKPHELYHFYRKELPLAGGISNVDLSQSWVAHYHPSPLLDYLRISPTGPMTPLVVTTTTLGHQFHLGVTYRTGLISDARAAAVADAFLARLETI
jgi:hypothetical protein